MWDIELLKKYIRGHFELYGVTVNDFKLNGELNSDNTWSLTFLDDVYMIYAENKKFTLKQKNIPVLRFSILKYDSKRKMNDYFSVKYRGKPFYAKDEITVVNGLMDYFAWKMREVTNRKLDGITNYGKN